MNFTLHQLQIFLEVARQESITRAAEEMYMTQPALSIQLKNFQRQFDIPLTEKIGKRLYLTDFGKTIAETAENILKEADSLKYKTREYEGLLVGKLRISSASTGKYVVPYFLSAFMAQYPGIDLQLDVSNKTAVMNNIKNNEVDFALVSVVPDKVKIEEEILLENKLFLVSSESKRNPDAPLIYREEGSATRGVMEDFFGSPSQRRSIQLTSNEAVKQAVIAGLGQSILPLIGLRNELSKKQLFLLDVPQLPISTFWRLIWLSDKKLSPIAQAYLEYVQSHKSDIIKRHFKWYLKFS